MRGVRGVVERTSRQRCWTRRAVMVSLLCIAALGSACKGNTEEQEVAEPVAPTWLVVHNQAFLDVNVFVYRSSQRVRLGTVSGSSTARLLIPANLLFGSTPLRFQADPIGGQRKPVSQEISVSAGDEVHAIALHGVRTDGRLADGNQSVPVDERQPVDRAGRESEL